MGLCLIKVESSGVAVVGGVRFLLPEGEDVIGDDR